MIYMFAANIFSSTEVIFQSMTILDLLSSKSLKAIAVLVIIDVRVKAVIINYTLFLIILHFIYFIFIFPFIFFYLFFILYSKYLYVLMINI